LLRDTRYTSERKVYTHAHANNNIVIKNK